MTNEPTKPRRFGIIGAMNEEIAKLQEHVTDRVDIVHNHYLTFTEGKLHGREVVFAKCQVGQIFAASVATTLITVFKVDAVIFTGVAGAMSEDLNVGDIVVGHDVICYDMNCKNFLLPWDMEYRHKLGEIPIIRTPEGKALREFLCTEHMIDLALKAPRPEGVKMKRGRIITGSEFLTSERKKELRALLEQEGTFGEVSAVEMEGAAVAQICHVYNVPFILLRSISDSLHGDALVEFSTFVQSAADNLWSVVSYIVSNY
eukprot:GEZU01002247.1.p1 GENE.GEZU01002247.1~~GEZU01002247.1.p1  ORF type:complete len:259 (-),score=60.37 GEZU01002247.1:174-950(-)